MITRAGDYDFLLGVLDDLNEINVAVSTVINRSNG